MNRIVVPAILAGLFSGLAIAMPDQQMPTPPMPDQPISAPRPAATASR